MEELALEGGADREAAAQVLKRWLRHSEVFLIFGAPVRLGTVSRSIRALNEKLPVGGHGAALFWF